MNRNYEHPTVDEHWYSSRETHPLVAAAIHAISSHSRPGLGVRTAEEIWEDPTDAELDHITMAVEEYLRHGDAEPEPDGKYAWGEEPISVTAFWLVRGHLPSTKYNLVHTAEGQAETVVLANARWVEIAGELRELGFDPDKPHGQLPKTYAYKEFEEFQPFWNEPAPSPWFYVVEEA